MLQRFVNLSICYFEFILIVDGLSVTLDDTKAIDSDGSNEATRESFFINASEPKTILTINDTRTTQNRIIFIFPNSTIVEPQTSTAKGETIDKSSANLQINITDESGMKKFNNLFADSSKRSEVNEKDQFIHMEEMRNFSGRIRDNVTRADVNKIRRKLIDVMTEQRSKSKKRKKVRILQDSTAGKKCLVEEGRQTKYSAYDVHCTEYSLNDTYVSLRSLFRVPKLRKPTDCSSRKSKLEAPFRFYDKWHTELIDQYEKERSSSERRGEYVHPEGRILPRTTDNRKMHVVHSMFGLHESKLQSGSIPSSSKYSFNDYIPANSFFNEIHKNGHFSASKNTSNGIIDNEARVKNRYNDDSVKIDYYLSLKRKRQVETILDDKINSEEKLLLTAVRSENVQNSREETTQTYEKQIQNTTFQTLLDLHHFENTHTTDNPWPLVPGPISCELDFQLQPSFVAKLGEFDYVVSVQLQRNLNEPADHACTGVVYNPRFIVIAPHCLHDNYRLTVTSTDDLCTIDEMIDVDYIIEHEDYDAETRKNDIALIKLKSEIHKRAAKFPKEDGVPGKTFYAVGFGELMWRSFPDKIIKLLQKVPVRRYSRLLKEAPGTLHITTSHMDLTGAFRGDYGGALINTRGEFVGLKSKLMKKSTEYEVYTKVQSYLPWIQSMVALHGSW